MEKKMSVGVIVFGILLVLSPTYFILSVLIQFLIKSVSLRLLPNAIISIYTSRPLVPLLQVFYLICGIGILKLKEWARRIIMYFSSFMVALGLVTIIFNVPIPLIFKLTIIIVNGLLYLFFTHPKVKEQFR